MEFIKSESPKNILRKSQRKIESHGRDIDRQDRALTQKENELVKKLKALAQDRDSHHMLKLVATDIFRLRKNRRTLQRSKNNLSNMENRILAAQSTQAINESFRTTTIAMAQIANDVNPKHSRNMIRHFERFNEEMASFTEMIDEAVDDASLVDGDRDAVDGIDDNPDTMVEVLLSEIGLDMQSSFPEVPQSVHENVSTMDDLSARLNNLRNT